MIAGPVKEKSPSLQKNIYSNAAVTNNNETYKSTTYLTQPDPQQQQQGGTAVPVQNLSRVDLLYGDLLSLHPGPQPSQHSLAQVTNVSQDGNTRSIF